ncbi:hypothetical protein STEG23_029814 [Scotinomys teguina]
MRKPKATRLSKSQMDSDSKMGGRGFIQRLFPSHAFLQTLALTFSCHSWRGGTMWMDLGLAESHPTDIKAVKPLLLKSSSEFQEPRISTGTSGFHSTAESTQ